MSVTSRVSASAFSPRARIAAAASSISDLVRAASVTGAPAAASAEAAARPMPRPPPVTSARLPSRRNEGVLARSIDGMMCSLSEQAHAGIVGHADRGDKQRAERQGHAGAALADVFIGPADAIGVDTAPEQQRDAKRMNEPPGCAIPLQKREQDDRERDIFGEIALHADAPFEHLMAARAEPDARLPPHHDHARRQKDENQAEYRGVERHNDRHVGCPL